MGRSETRPYVVCHMLASLDGRIEGGFFAEPKCSAAQKEYASLRSFFSCEATLYGTTTALEFAGGEAGQLPRPKQLLPYADYRAPAKEHDYLVAVDARGRIGWQSGTFARPGRPEAHIIELLTEQTAPEYLEYLRERGISYIVAGRNRVDFKSALRRLNELFGVKRVMRFLPPVVTGRVMLAGGGLINGALLDAGVIDELSVVLAPVIDGGDGAALFDRCGSAGLELIESRQLDGGGLWLRYKAS